MIHRNDLSPEKLKLADEILSHGIDSDEVLRLRREVFADGVVGPDEVRLLFHLNEQGTAGHDPAWYDFFVEALTDYFVWRQEPAGYVSDADVGFLAELIDHDGKIDDATEFALLVNILHRVKVAQPALVELALDGVKQTVIGGGTVLFGPQRRRSGIIDDADLDVIRAVVFGAGGDGSLTISRREAELLFDLNRATAGKKNTAGWRTLYVEALGHHLMYPEGAPKVVDRDEAMRREAWLDERRGTGAFMKAMGAGLKSRIGQALRDDDPKTPPPPPPAAGPCPMTRAAVDRAEAEWLAERLLADGELDGNEVALLDYIRRTAPTVDTALDPLFAKAGL